MAHLRVATSSGGANMVCAPRLESGIEVHAAVDGSTVPPIAGYVLGAELNCSELASPGHAGSGIAVRTRVTLLQCGRGCSTVETQDAACATTVRGGAMVGWPLGVGRSNGLVRFRATPPTT
jgi:hypothetical protein